MKLAKRSAGTTLLCLTLTACQTTGSVGTDKSIPCAALTPILWSKADTRETQNQVTEYNAVGVRVCGWGK